MFYTKGGRLKVRQAFADDDFSKCCRWKDKLEFIVSDSGNFTMLWTSLLPDLEPEYAHAFVDLVGARYPVSRHYHELKNMCPDLAFSDATDELVFYGGSFNPWHMGHQACLDLLPDDKVCLILPDRNPHKELREVNPVTTILEISTKGRFKNNQYLVPTFLLDHKQNPTVEWIERMEKEFPSQKHSLLMGFDSFSKLKTWTRAKDLIPKLYAIYVVSRLEDDEDKREALDQVHALGSNLNIVFLGKHAFEDLSSTDIRKKGFYAL